MYGIICSINETYFDTVSLPVINFRRALAVSDILKILCADSTLAEGLVDWSLHTSSKPDGPRACMHTCSHADLRVCKVRILKFAHPQTKSVPSNE